MEDQTGQSFRRNSGFILALFLFWSFLCICCVFYYSIIRQQELRKKARQIAWVQGNIPALRGTIYSSGGERLAYSTFEFFVLFKSEETGKHLTRLLGREIAPEGKISAKEMQFLESHLSTLPGPLRIEAREVRISPPELKDLEEKYDSVLRGKDGKFVVMLTRFRRRVPGTMKILRQQVPGKSVVLSRGEESGVLP